MAQRSNRSGALGFDERARAAIPAPRKSPLVPPAEPNISLRDPSFSLETVCPYRFAKEARSVPPPTPTRQLGDLRGSQPVSSVASWHSDHSDIAIALRERVEDIAVQVIGRDENQRIGGNMLDLLIVARQVLRTDNQIPVF